MIKTVVGPDDEPIRVGSYTDLADELGVTNKQVYMWYQRRARNGFPDPVCHQHADNGRMSPHWDIDEVLAWRIFYDPSPGGWHAQKRNLSA